MSFHNVILPQFMRAFLVASPSYSTSIARTNSGRELRSSDNNLQHTKYSIKDCYLSKDQFDNFNSFFRARMGQRFSFLLKDPAEYFLEKHKVDGIFEGNRIRIERVYKYYHDEARAVIKPIKYIDPSTVSVWVDDKVYSGSIAVENGAILLQGPFSIQSNIFVSCEYFHEVRFGQDSFQYKLADNGSIMISDIEMLEILQ